MQPIAGLLVPFYHLSGKGRAWVDFLWYPPPRAAFPGALVSELALRDPGIMWCMHSIFSVKSHFLSNSKVYKYVMMQAALSCAELQGELCTLCNKNKEV